MANEIRKGDIGVALRFTVKKPDGSIYDLTTATILEVIYRKPNSGTVVTKTASKVTTGSDGKLQYKTTSASDLDEAGPYQAQVRVVDGELDVKSKKVTFKVEDTLA